MAIPINGCPRRGGPPWGASTDPTEVHAKAIQFKDKIIWAREKEGSA